VRAGVGTDIVAVPRIAALMRARGAAFLERWFTAREIDYCSRKAVPSRHFAARFAAKEAVVKALPVAWDGPLPWRSIEIVTDARGAPSVVLSGAILDAATRAGGPASGGPVAGQMPNPVTRPAARGVGSGA